MLLDINMEHAITSLTDALRAARERKGISQRALSAKLGIPQSRLSRIENAAVDVRTSSLLGLARALDLEPVLVPRRLVPAVTRIIADALASGGAEPTNRPLYRLDDGDENA